jgi:3-hydroxyisobutyrate dehydrogenase
MKAISNRTTIAFLGLGNMGTPMSRLLVEAGFDVRGFDPASKARERFAEMGGKPCESATFAVRDAAVVVLMLPNSTVVESVLRDVDVLAELTDSAVIIDMSSSEPLRTRALANELARRGIEMLDAPVSGGVGKANTGELTIMVGGDEAVFDAAAPLFAPLGKATRVGEIGAGHALKALNNLLSATHLLATSAAVITGRRFGLDPNVMLSVINASSGQSASSTNKLPKFVLPETYDSGFGLRLMLKDMRIATDLAEQVGSPDLLGQAVVDLWTSAAEELPDDADHTEIARWLGAHVEPATAEQTATMRTDV